MNTMWLVYVLVVWQIRAIPEQAFNMYNTDMNDDHYCLLYYVIDDIIDPDYDSFTHEIIPYCLRSSTGSIFIRNSSFNNTNGNKYSFAELRKKNISSKMLLSWSAPIDLAERYQIFLSNISSESPSEEEIWFYNCTSSWFGPFCRFAFSSLINVSFHQIVVDYFQSKLKINNTDDVPCYQHLNCQYLSKCLDWRDICDKKLDCLDGSDEKDCWQLEVNECAENEYRCHNGQCIPIEFLNDDSLNPDCIDKTDEQDLDKYYSIFCYKDPTFRCEEETCRPSKRNFPCGDGECRLEKTSDCHNGRNNILATDLCSHSMICLINAKVHLNNLDKAWCNQYCTTKDCVRDNCPSQFEFPPGPILFGHVRFIYTNKGINLENNEIYLPDYICYNEQLCKEYIRATKYLNGSTCRAFHELELEKTILFTDFEILITAVKNKFRACLNMINQTFECNHSNMYQCSNSSKCISKHRLVDGYRDCPFGDDEIFENSCSLKDAHLRSKCLYNNTIMCLSPSVPPSATDQCIIEENEYVENRKSIEKHISFQTTCDGKVELSPIIIDGKKYTDETDCERWPCNNTYSQCDSYWLCKNGADESNCPLSICPNFQHPCIFLNDTSKISCLPISKAGDGIVDCLAGTDERKNCQYPSSKHMFYAFQCSNNTECIDVSQVCDQEKDCPLDDDDEKFCVNSPKDICQSSTLSSRTQVEHFLCQYLSIFERPKIVYFKMQNMPIYPRQLTTATATATVTTSTQSITSLMRSNSIINIYDKENLNCNRGIPIRIRKNDDDDNNNYRLFCLCPPSYYGDQCQYQNERVSVTIQVRVISEWLSVFTFIIKLIDDNGIIESHDSIEYLRTRDCNKKFHLYLLYSTRPKSLSKNYFVQIDLFDRLNLKYRVSWIFPIQYKFLPVYRLAVSLDIPSSDFHTSEKCSPSCIHGECLNYINSKTQTFCRCFPNWTGRQCNIKYVCNCAFGSLCIGNSICICPLNKFGPRCYFSQISCHSNFCLNGGQCIPRDERHHEIDHLNKVTCICPKQYGGDRCERQQSEINISFDNDIDIPSSLLIHFITVQNQSEPIRFSIMKKIQFDQHSISFYTSTIFNIAFIEMKNNYYLIILQEKDIVSSKISTKIIPSHRCLSINELFNRTFVNQHLLKRIKSYHSVCQEHMNLVCFYDSIYFCLCDLSRQANCFEFDYNMNYNCRGYNLCENDGQCFQDDPTCPSSSICVCHDCYYGSKCQFSTKGSTLSLDVILAYAIHRNISINQQSIIVKFLIGFSTIIFFLGLISGIFSFITFHTKKSREVGCGIYLFTSSILSLITMILFMIKIWILLTIQIGSIKNRLFISIQCICIDFILRILISSSDWLSACIAIERAINVSQGVHFNRIKSRQIAKLIIPIVLVLCISTHVHDPIRRLLVDDKDEQRTWCIVNYSLILHIYDRILNVIHFSIPFSINCISALIVIITAARTRSTIHKNRSYKQLLNEQWQYHKHLLISPIILIFLALPRLIISFMSGCMKSARNPWIYLIGYFISFTPQTLTFIVFVLPSETYRIQFKSSIKRFW